MKIRDRLAATTAVALMLGGAAQAQDYMALAQELYAQGYENQATIRVRGNELHVEVSGSAGSTERVYSIDGSTLLEEETLMADGRKVEREYDTAGNLVEEEVEEADEEDDEDDEEEEDEDGVDDSDDSDDDSDDDDDSDSDSDSEDDSDSENDSDSDSEDDGDSDDDSDDSEDDSDSDSEDDSDDED